MTNLRLMTTSALTLTAALSMATGPALAQMDSGWPRRGRFEHRCLARLYRARRDRSGL